MIMWLQRAHVGPVTLQIVPVDLQTTRTPLSLCWSLLAC